MVMISSDEEQDGEMAEYATDEMYGEDSSARTPSKSGATPVSTTTGGRMSILKNSSQMLPTAAQIVGTVLGRRERMEDAVSLMVFYSIQNVLFKRMVHLTLNIYMV